MTTVAIARGSDPFKKYWWVILLVFGAIGAWICLPLMGSTTGSGSVSAQEGGLKSSDQSLDSIGNPNGAPGGAVDLSMGGSYRKKSSDGGMVSSLYQAPQDHAAGTSLTPAAGQSFADALKDISRKSAAAAKPGDSGWGEKAQKGFTPPKGNFGAMSGFSGSSGSGASASAAGGGGVVSGFGSSKANTGVDFARGLKDQGADGKGGRAMGALQNAQAASVAAARQGSGDAAVAMSAATFDGSNGSGRVVGGGAGTSGGGVYGSLDAAPMNLKINDPNLDAHKVDPPPTPMPKDETDPNDKMRQMVMQMLIQAVVGGLMGGITGAMGLGGAGAAAGGAKIWSLPAGPRECRYADFKRRPYGSETT